MKRYRQMEEETRDCLQKSFEKYFPDFHKKYGISDMYSGGFYPYETLEEYWAWWSRHIYINRYDITAGKPYMDLLNIVKDKDYFVLTTNVDHQFQLAGFDKKRLFYTQGDYGLWQCSRACHDKTYDNEETVRLMIKTQKNMKIPSDLIIPLYRTTGGIQQQAAMRTLSGDTKKVTFCFWNLALAAIPPLLSSILSGR